MAAMLARAEEKVSRTFALREWRIRGSSPRCRMRRPHEVTRTS